MIAIGNERINNWPNIATIAIKNFPIKVCGIKSPYPHVVNVTMHIHAASETDYKAFGLLSF